MHEWPIVEAAVLPAAAVAVSVPLDLDYLGTAWLAMSVAVAFRIAGDLSGVRRPVNYNKA